MLMCIDFKNVLKKDSAVKFMVIIMLTAGPEIQHSALSTQHYFNVYFKQTYKIKVGVMKWVIKSV